MSGTISQLNLTVAGATLSLTDALLTNAGLSASQVTLKLPAVLGGAVIAIPEIKFGDGSKVKFTKVGLHLTSSGGVYQFAASGTLVINLPGNSQSASAKLTQRDFHATLWIDVYVARGNVNVNAWSSRGEFHLTGSARMELGIPQGKIWKGCMPGIECKVSFENLCSCAWYRPWCCIPLPSVDCWTTEWCLTIPPADLILGQVGIEMGEFTSGKWGFKGYASVLGQNVGFYIDTSGNLSFTNVDQYKLAKPSQVAAARVAQAARLRGEALSADLAALDYISFAPQGDILIDTPIPVQGEVTFALRRNSSAPTLTLVSSLGRPIGPGNLPANVLYAGPTCRSPSASPTRWSRRPPA